MAEVTPFAAIRYDYTKVGGDLSNLIAPPYDVLDQSDKDALLAKDPHNIVGIDLPHVPPKSLGPDEAYQRSAQLLGDWQKDGTLVREQRPAIYLYHQTFEYAGTTHTRRKLIARVRLQPFSEGIVLPHEKTFGGAKEDRLALMKVTKVNMSPIFGLFTDKENKVGTAMASTAARQPEITATLEGVKEQMWIETDATVCDAVARALADKKIYIADGHHRYGTALLYRDWLAEQNGGSLPPDHPANHVMFVLASMDDPGCLIIPYYRALANIDLKTVVDAWGPGTAACGKDEADIVLVEPSTGAEQALKFTDRAHLHKLTSDECAPWYDLDASYLHRYLIDELLKAKIGNDPKIRYIKSEAHALETAKVDKGVALLVKATPMEHLRAVAEAGGLMPQKSTYFYPKLATGMTINPLE